MDIAGLFVAICYMVAMNTFIDNVGVNGLQFNRKICYIIAYSILSITLMIISSFCSADKFIRSLIVVIFVVLFNSLYYNLTRWYSNRASGIS